MPPGARGYTALVCTRKPLFICVAAHSFELSLLAVPRTHELSCAGQHLTIDNYCYTRSASRRALYHRAKSDYRYDTCKIERGCFGDAVGDARHGGAAPFVWSRRVVHEPPSDAAVPKQNKNTTATPLEQSSASYLTVVFRCVRIAHVSTRGFCLCVVLAAVVEVFVKVRTMNCTPHAQVVPGKVL